MSNTTRHVLVSEAQLLVERLSVRLGQGSIDPGWADVVTLVSGLLTLLQADPAPANDPARLIHEALMELSPEVDGPDHERVRRLLRTALESSQIVPPILKEAREQLWTAIGLYDATPDSIDIDRATIDQVDRAIDAFVVAVEAAAASKAVCEMGVYCREHDFVHGAEAEELRERFEALVAGADDVTPQQIQRVLDDVDARDSVTVPAAPPAKDGK